MRSTQQRFWPDAQPLVERLGRDFFRQLPETAGVYQMRSAEKVLYVGKAKNLRHRLCSYRVANPERMARRTLRLLNLVKAITWEEFPDEASALRRETELLLRIKPRFNRAGIWEGPRRFLAWRPHATGLELAVIDSADKEWQTAGSFGAQAIHLLRALVRLLWCRLRPESGLVGMPAGWIRGAHGNHVIIPHSDHALVADASMQMTTLADGKHDEFLQWLVPVAKPFERSLQDEDLELVVKHLPGRSVLLQNT